MKKIIAITAATLTIAGCSNMSNTEQRTLSGASIGAVAGGVGAAIFHANPIWGAVGGAAIGRHQAMLMMHIRKTKHQNITLDITQEKIIKKIKHQIND